MDDGNWLGSMDNDECRIDSIAQSWGVISKPLIMIKSLFQWRAWKTFSK